MCTPAMAFIEHDFQNGLTVKNSSLVRDYQKFYQNVYPGNGPLVGRGQPGRHRVQSRGLQSHDQPQQRLQPDRLRLQGLHRTVVPHDCVRHGVRPAGRHRRPQHRHLPERHQHDRRQPVRPDLFRHGQLHPSLSRAPTPTASPRPTPTANIISTSRRPTRGTRSKSHALAAVDRRGPLRPLRLSALST